LRPASPDGADRVLRPLLPATRDERLGDLHAALSGAQVGILHRDLSQRVLSANEAYCALVGRSAETLDGMPFADFTHPDDVERAQHAMQAHLAAAEPFEIEKRYVRPDGSIVWCAVHVAFVCGPDGRPTSTIVVAADVTKRREAERELRASEEHYRHSVEHNPQIAWSAAPDGSILEVSPRWHGVTGVSREAALCDGWMTALHPDDVQRAAAVWAAAITSGEPADVTYRVRVIDGSYRWYRARATAHVDGAGAVVRWYGSLEDVHDRRLAEDALRDSEERFRLAAQAAGLGIWDYDAVNDRREWSAEFRAMLGIAQDAPAELATALACVVPQDRYRLQALLDAAQAGDSSARFEVMVRIRRADTGAERWMRTSGWRMNASSGRLERVLVTIRDVTDERTAAERVRWSATHDALTRIPNRAHFNEQLDRAIARASAGSELALLLLDVDHLKEINDTIGHDAGDALLRTFASRLKRAFGPTAAIGRLGGDEFAVLLEGPTENLPRRVGDALTVLSARFDYDGQLCDAQATAGVSVYPGDGESAADLLKAADIALYVGKAGRRGTACLFDPAMRGGMQRRASMLSLARVAVRDDLVEAFYQPKIDLRDGRIAGFEALLRWRHGTLGVQTPDTIVSAFDDINLAVALSDRMLARIARDVRGWLDAGLDPGRVAVNLAPAEFRQEQLVARVLEPFARAGIPPNLLELEITETVLLGRDADRVAGALAAFHRAGVTIALDDFGTGYASLTHLKAFPVDVIKIDRSFIGNLREGSDDAAIVDAIVGLAHRLRMDVVAEGIEQSHQAAYLRARNCTYGQGFLFSRGRRRRGRSAAARRRP
jgi:diguanylate cyclase (GGDEF)-like protein/PAS domain S-box-containing protein